MSQGSVTFAVAVAMGCGVVAGMFIAALCASAKRGDELNEQAWREVAPDELEDWTQN